MPASGGSTSTSSQTSSPATPSGPTETAGQRRSYPWAVDTVSVSDIALDAIWASQVGWDAVKTKSMAVGKFAVGRAGLDGADYADVDAVAASQTAMDAVSTSTTAMDAVAASDLAMDAVIASDDIALPTVVESATAMDSVSTSSTALDSIWQSQLAWDTVKTKAMAVGKFVAGRAGLDGANYADIDAVAADQTAMDAVAGSQTAMDAVAASIDARSSVLESDYALGSLWASTPGARTILESGGSPTLPNTYNFDRSSNSALHVEIEDGSDIGLPGDATSALELRVVDSDADGGDLGTRRGLTVSLDLSNSSTLEFQQRADNCNTSNEKWGVDIDGSVIWSTGGNTGWTNRSVDVSSYGGTHDVMFYHQNNDYYGDNYNGWFTDINLL